MQAIRRRGHSHARRFAQRLPCGLRERTKFIPVAKAAGAVDDELGLGNWDAAALPRRDWITRRLSVDGDVLRVCRGCRVAREPPDRRSEKRVAPSRFVIGSGPQRLQSHVHAVIFDAKTAWRAAKKRAVEETIESGPIHQIALGQLHG